MAHRLNLAHGVQSFGLQVFSWVGMLSSEGWIEAIVLVAMDARAPVGLMFILAAARAAASA